MGLYDRALVDMLLKIAGTLSRRFGSRGRDSPRFADGRRARRRAGSGSTCSWPRQVGGVSRSQLARHIAEGAVTVNGAAGGAVAQAARRATWSSWTPPPPAATEIWSPRPSRCAIVHEDRWLVVIDKPAGLVVHPAPGHEAGTLVNALLAHCHDLRGIGGELRPGIVHRIDKDTSGLLVVAKDDATMDALGAAFKAHTDRARLRRAGGRASRPAPGGRIDTLHGRDPRDRKKFCSRVRTGKRAVTTGGWSSASRARRAIEARLETGRTHQVRVHFAALGCPLLGDETYGKPPRDPALRDDRRGAGAAGAARALAGLRSPGDRGADGVRPRRCRADMTRAFAALRALGDVARSRARGPVSMMASERGSCRCSRSAAIPAPLRPRLHHPRRAASATPPFDALNLGGKWGDDARGGRRESPPVAPGRGRRRALYVARQVHGARVARGARRATIPRRSPRDRGRRRSAPTCPGVTLGVFVADCIPALSPIRAPARSPPSTPAGAAPSPGCCRRRWARWSRAFGAPPGRSARRAGARHRPLLLRGGRRGGRAPFAAAARRATPIVVRPSPRARPTSRTSICRRANRLLLERAGVDPDAIDERPRLHPLRPRALLLLPPRRRAPPGS